MDVFQRMNDAMKKAKESYVTIPIEGNETVQKVLDYLEKTNGDKNLKNNLKTLTIQKYPYLNKEQPDGNYNPHNNTITINKEEALLHELIHCASTKDYDNDGVLSITYPNDFDKDIIITGKSFNEGFCDYLSKKIDPSYELRYPLESLIVERIIDKYGAEPLHYFLNSDSKRFHEFIDDNNLNSLLTDLDNYTNLFSESTKMIPDEDNLKVFYNSYQNIMTNDLKNILDEDKINDLEEDFFNTSIGAQTNYLLYQHEVKNSKKKK